MRQRTQRGLAIVEAALSLPVLTLLLLPVVEIGRAFVQYSELSHRVRAATRHVAEHALDGTTGVPVIDAALRAEAINLVVYGSSVANGTTTDQNADAEIFHSLLAFENGRANRSSMDIVRYVPSSRGGITSYSSYSYSSY